MRIFRYMEANIKMMKNKLIHPTKLSAKAMPIRIPIVPNPFHAEKLWTIPIAFDMITVPYTDRPINPKNRIGDNAKRITNTVHSEF